MVANRRILGQEEEDLLAYLLSLHGQPALTKSAIQRLCFALENGFYLTHTPGFRQQVLGHLWSDDILVRRWATKAIALLGLGTSTRKSVLTSRLRDEPDFENRTWLISAVSKLFRESNVKKICDDSGIDYVKEYELSVRLFQNESGLVPLKAKFVDIENDSHLTLKWVSLLEGYQRAPENLAHISIPNSEIIKQLNRHNDPIVSEYSVWSFWHHPNYDAGMLAFSDDDISTQAESVRRWIYRLFAKTPQLFVEDRDLFQSFTTDAAIKAREGLAIGLSHEIVSGIEDVILGWYSSEENPEVRDLVLEHMAKNSDLDPRYQPIITDEYVRQPVAGAFRKRILSSSAGTALLNELRKIELKEGFDRLRVDVNAEPTLFGNGSTVVQNIKIGSIGNVGNLSLGDQTINAEALEQTFKGSSTEGVEALKAVLDYLPNAKEISDDERNRIAAEVRAMIEKPSEENAGSLKSRMVSVLSALGDGAKIAGQLKKVIELLDGWIG